MRRTAISKIASLSATPVRRTIAGPNATAICQRCLQQQRYSSALTSFSKSPLAGFAPLGSRSLLSIGGADSAKFLQGLITGSITTKDGRPRQDAFYTAFLNATGRVIHDVFIYPQPQSFDASGNGPKFFIEADAGQIDILVKYIKRYKLRAKVDVRKLLPDEASIWQVWGADATQLDTPASSNSRLVMKDPRAPSLGYRVLEFGSKPPDIATERATEEQYTLLRYFNGVAEGQHEIIREQALPLESNMEMMQGIDFYKGCYVGQELTIRTKHRGVVRKRILPCIIYEKDRSPPQAMSFEPETGSPESLTADMIPQDTSIGRSEKRGRSAGKWLKGIGNIGLGLCRLETMTDLTLPGEQASSTFSIDSEFAMEWGEEDSKNTVKVKAFVPDWLRQALEESKR